MGAQPAEVRASGGLATHTLCITQNCPTLSSKTALAKSMVTSAKHDPDTRTRSRAEPLMVIFSLVSSWVN